MSPDNSLEQLDQPAGRDRGPAGAGAAVPAASRGEEVAALRRALRTVGVLAAAVLLLALVRMTVVQSFVIPSSSMQPTLQVGDRVLVSRLDYRFGDVHRGDVIVFSGDGVFDPPQPPPANALTKLGRTFASALGAPVGERDYAKRVIGLPGDRVVCCDATGRLTVNGTPLSETYLPTGTVPSETRFDVVVPAGRLWVMGDNRGVSADSRAHLGDPGGGTVPLDHVVGRVVAVWWPFSRGTGVGSVDATRGTTR
ncbi:MAG TPA: signal peptidase I [Kineosporiaceae bacterium]|nr:signal peptidase I [Kineosporiaceae bacterium]